MRRLTALLAALGLAACAHAPPAAAPASLYLESRSAVGFEETLSRLRAGIEARGFAIVAEVDHAAAAERAGLALAPTTLVIFGNPAGGTPLMQAEQAVGIDLPLKALVRQTPAGEVVLTWTAIEPVLASHGVRGQEARAARIAATLAELAAEATAPAR